MEAPAARRLALLLVEYGDGLASEVATLLDIQIEQRELWEGTPQADRRLAS